MQTRLEAIGDGIESLPSLTCSKHNTVAREPLEALFRLMQALTRTLVVLRKPQVWSDLLPKVPEARLSSYTATSLVLNEHP